MGILRLLLALSVVMAHSNPFLGIRLLGGPAAVQTFFMISGFYIQLILSKRYVGPGSLRSFYINRFLRLFPAYWMVLAFTVAAAALDAFPSPELSPIYYWKLWGNSFTLSSCAILAWSNIVLFFQDVVMFLHVDPASGGLQFTGNFLATTRPGYVFLLVPQAWSLGIELSFYLLAPWLLRLRLTVLIAVAFGSLALRYRLGNLGLDHDPWTYRFFPTELAFFLTGALGCRFYLARVVNRKIPAWLPGLATGTALGFTAGFQWIFPATIDMPAWPYYAVIAMTLPLVFHFSRDSRWDGFIGDLSYPIYVAHLVVVNLVGFPGVRSEESMSARTGQILLNTLVFALALKFATRPFEKWRAARVLALRPAPPRKIGKSRRTRKAV